MIDCSFDDTYNVPNASICDHLPAPNGTVAENYYPCEAGGHGPMSSTTKGTFYFPKFFMDEVRSRCPATCGTCQCVDSSTFVDSKGQSCTDWQVDTLPTGGNGVADCALADATSALADGYTATEMQTIRVACPSTCGWCSSNQTFAG